MQIRQDLPQLQFGGVKNPLRPVIWIFIFSVLLVAVISFFVYPFLHKLINLSNRLEIAIAIVSASVLVFIISYLIIRSYLKHVINVVEIHNLCSKQHEILKKEYERTAKDITEYNNLLCNHLNEAITHTENEILKVVEKLMDIHNRSKEQTERIGSSVDKSNELIETMRSQVKSNEEIIKVLDNFAQQQAAQLEDNLNRIQQLSDDIKELTPLVDIITEIADQTNLLALNAAIEAARAGESGRGFSVVAEEVRKLSGRTNEAAKDIANRISKVSARVQREIENAFDILEKNTSSNQFKQLSDSLRDIEKRFKDAAQVLEDVIHGIEEANTVIMENVSSVLGEIQFQDVLRQRVEHVINALEIMSKVANDIILWLHGKTDQIPEPLSKYLDEIKEKYVMHEERVLHSKVTGEPLAVSEDAGPKIELF